MIFLVRKNIRYGGAELLIERIASGINQSGNKCLIICNNISETMSKRFNTADIDVRIVQNWTSREYMAKLITSDDIVVTTWIHDLFLFDMIRRYTRKKFEIVHYVITADDLCLGKSIPTNIGKRLFQSYYKKIVNIMHKDNRFVYMDEESFQKPEKFYFIELKNPYIVRLPYSVHELNQEKLKLRVKGKESQFNILSVSRAEFPMKGYLVELVSKFELFYSNHKDTNLYIVTFGDGINEIKMRYDSLQGDAKEHVHIMGQMSYEELEKYWDIATVYVGLGTSVLDASDRGICSIAALQYSMKFKAQNFFYERPEQISCDMDTELDGYNIIDRVYKMTSEEYASSCIMCHDKLKEYYELNTAIDKILSNGKRCNYTYRWSVADYLLEKFFLWYDDRRNVEKKK